MADVLLAAGAEVTMASRHEAIGAILPYPPATVAAARERLMGGDFDHIGGPISSGSHLMAWTLVCHMPAIHAASALGRVI